MGRGRGGGRDRGPRRDRRDDGDELIEKVVDINRVAKVVKGGRRFSFTAIVVVGDGKGRVGFGFGRANEVPEAIRKGGVIARRSMFPVAMRGSTIAHDQLAVFKASKVVLRSASPGTGLIAGGPARAVLEAAGVSDVLTKSLGSNNPVNVVRATIEGLRALRHPEQVVARRHRLAEEQAIHVAQQHARQERASAGGGRGGGRGGSVVVARIRITWERSAIGRPADQGQTIRRLGLHRLHETVEHEDTPQVLGMAHKVRHLVRVEEVR